MSAIPPLLEPDAFIGLEGITHLCTGGEAPWLKAHADVYDTFARWKGEGEPGRRRIYECGERCRAKMSTLWGVPAARIGFSPSAAEGMAWLARGLDWREGDNVVSTNLEFPSVAYAWRNLKQAGVETRLVQHVEWQVSEQDLLDAVDERTRVVAVSQVSFYTGQNLDIQRLADGLRRKPRRVLLAVDATHASGVVQVPAAVTDLCVSSSYKWMLATHGVAPCYLSEREDDSIRESSFGWRNLDVWPGQGAEREAEVAVKPMPEKIEPGNPAMLVVMLLDRALEALLGIGIERIESHARELAGSIDSGLQGSNKTVISPHDPQARSGNTCFLADDSEAVVEELAKRGVLVWGGSGRVRVSGHLYNGTDDVEKLLRALHDIDRN